VSDCRSPQPQPISCTMTLPLTQLRSAPCLPCWLLMLAWHALNQVGRQRTLSPVSSMSTSPTTISVFNTSTCFPARTTLTLISSFWELSFLNCFSLL
jgi:hypothetical protein